MYFVPFPDFITKASLELMLFASFLDFLIGAIVMNSDVETTGRLDEFLAVMKENEDSLETQLVLNIPPSHGWLQVGHTLRVYQSSSVRGPLQP